jgi:FkbM family methyltransferase
VEIRYPDMLRRFRWWLTYLGPRRDVTIDTFNGLLTVDSKDWLIGKRLYVQRGYEAAEMQRIMALLREEGYVAGTGDGVLIDVGANIGMTCIALLKHRYFRRAIAFEPAPSSYRLLVHNVRQNGLSDRIVHFQCALSCSDEKSELELSTDNSGNHRLRRTTRPGVFGEEHRRTVSVEVRTLDQVFANDPALSKENISLIWLDVEGHEGPFFLGAREVVKVGIPVVAEFWPYSILRSGMSREDYCRVLSDLFTAFYVLAGEQFEKRPISEIDLLFDVYSRPKQMCQTVLVRDV